jgi:hypothetical protein
MTRAPVQPKGAHLSVLTEFTTDPLMERAEVVRRAEAHDVSNPIAACMLAIDRAAFTIKQRGIYA